MNFARGLARRSLRGAQRLEEESRSDEAREFVLTKFVVQTSTELKQTLIASC